MPPTVAVATWGARLGQDLDLDCLRLFPEWTDEVVRSAGGSSISVAGCTSRVFVETNDVGIGNLVSFCSERLRYLEWVSHQPVDVRFPRQIPSRRCYFIPPFVIFRNYRKLDGDLTDPPDDYLLIPVNHNSADITRNYEIFFEDAGRDYCFGIPSFS